MQYLQLAYIIISAVFIFFLVFPFLKVFLSGLFVERVKVENELKQLDYANVITAYRNANISKNLIQSLLKQTHGKHHIYLVADNCDVSDWDIDHQQLTVLNPQPALNLKVKSIIHEIFKKVEQYNILNSSHFFKLLGLQDDGLLVLPLNLVISDFLGLNMF